MYLGAYHNAIYNSKRQQNKNRGLTTSLQLDTTVIQNDIDVDINIPKYTDMEGGPQYILCLMNKKSLKIAWVLWSIHPSFLLTYLPDLDVYVCIYTNEKYLKG